jgi:hypothetical protein
MTEWSPLPVNWHNRPTSLIEIAGTFNCDRVLEHILAGTPNSPGASASLSGQEEDDFFLWRSFAVANISGTSSGTDVSSHYFRQTTLNYRWEWV